MPYVEVSTGVRLFYEDRGAGVPVILVHGWIGSAEEHFPRVMAWLEPNYRVLGITRRGYGLSRPPARDYPDDFYHRDARDLLAFMDALNIEKAHVVGYSDGGEVALIAAGTQPDRFHSVTTWGAVGYFGPDMRAVAQRSAPATFLIEDPDLMERHGITNPKGFVGGWIRAVVHMIDAGGDVSLSLAPNISAPLLMMLGDKDTLNPEAFGRRFVDAAPNAQLVMFKDTGHPVHDEQWEKFVQVVGAFLAQHSPR